MEDSEYTLDIIEALLSMRDVEGEVNISIKAFNEGWKYVRFKKYPYDTPYYGQKFKLEIKTDEDIEKRMELMRLIVEERVVPYLMDYDYID